VKFEDLIAWQKAKELVNKAYVLTKQTPLYKDIGLCNQFQRAAVSVVTNIAEGFERIHIKEKIQYYNIARASCGEVRSLVCTISDLHVELRMQCQEMSPLIELTGKLITGLIKSTEKRKRQ